MVGMVMVNIQQKMEKFTLVNLKIITYTTDEWRNGVITGNGDIIEGECKMQK